MFPLPPPPLPFLPPPLPFPVPLPLPFPAPSPNQIVQGVSQFIANLPTPPTGGPSNIQLANGTSVPTAQPYVTQQDFAKYVESQNKVNAQLAAMGSGGQSALPYGGAGLAGYAYGQASAQGGMDNTMMLLLILVLFLPQLTGSSSTTSTTSTTTLLLVLVLFMFMGNGSGGNSLSTMDPLMIVLLLLLLGGTALLGG